MTVHCFICNNVIVKYFLDIGNTISIKNINNEIVFICDDCAKQIAMELIER